MSAMIVTAIDEAVDELVPLVGKEGCLRSGRSAAGQLLPRQSGR